MPNDVDGSAYSEIVCGHLDGAAEEVVVIFAATRCKIIAEYEAAIIVGDTGPFGLNAGDAL